MRTEKFIVRLWRQNQDACVTEWGNLKAAWKAFLGACRDVDNRIGYRAEIIASLDIPNLGQTVLLDSYVD